MSLDFKKILQLSGGIAAAVATGGLSTALIPAAIGLAGELVPEKKDDSKENDLDDWEREMIASWVAMYRRLMDIEMSSESRRRTAMGKLTSDFIMNYADVPKERWVEFVHSMIVMAVHGDMAASG